ncbi:LytTR family transcriptional regulator DNA-binding domain-containing protein [Perlabentimonas gracilis]|uniref:LytTR family transcriptional regulator DNA-binding domain-containing protein n=1 Tax=Perlabentimonas gracilis TaxID=2715279 RepID=UPI00140A92E0|nr:LytTR family transcriptional regulator DNA-binding domain-containing protein [Perlabentimonas gracilis]NHB67520.1 LytTR family transcriptional regulator [Perlabentimonas gracilis]
MVKVLVVPHEDIILGNPSTSIVLTTWFSINSIPEQSFSLEEWSQQSLLYSNGEVEIEVLTKGDNYCFLPIPSIVRVERDLNSSVMYLLNKQELITPFELEYWENLLRLHNFFLIHPNHLINIMHMQSYVKCNAFVKLSNSDAIPVVTNEAEDLINFLDKQTIL